MPKTSSPIPVKHIAQLANLNLTDDQLIFYQKSLSSVVDLMEQISSLDLKNVSPTARVIDEENILREDVVEKSLSQSEVLKNAKKHHAGFFVADYVLENKDA